jgi:MFS family permease
LQIRTDLRLTGDWQATLLVSVQGLAYCGASLPLGILADKLSRRRLMSAGLLLNAAAFLGLALAPGYGWAVFCVALAGFFGSFYHPAATALLVAIFPERPGQALGRAGMGAAFGFFFGPLYAGWRAEAAGWRQPCLELAVAGMAMAVLFEWLAREPHDAPHAAPRAEEHRTRNVWPVLLGVALVALAFACRDFGGSGMSTLSSLFLQRAHGFGAKMTGFYLGLMCLIAMLSNPIIGSISDKRRFPVMAASLLSAAVFAAGVPWLPRGWAWVGLTAYGFCLMSSFPVVEAALMESVPDALRGRTFGTFITVGGVIASLAHWAMGRAADGLAQDAHTPSSYAPWFAVLALLIALSLAGIPGIRWLRRFCARQAASAGKGDSNAGRRSA